MASNIAQNFERVGSPEEGYTYTFQANKYPDLINSSSPLRSILGVVLVFAIMGICIFFGMTFGEGVGYWAFAILFVIILITFKRLIWAETKETIEFTSNDKVRFKNIEVDLSDMDGLEIVPVADARYSKHNVLMAEIRGSKVIVTVAKCEVTKGIFNDLKKLSIIS